MTQSSDRGRRRFLAGAAGAAAAVSLSAAHADTSTGDDPWDVIVIGGGFAGVTAARDTSFRGLKTLLLEARPRLGGRAFTAPFAGHDLDLGGTWIGWSQPSIWAEVMRYGMAVDESAAATASEVIWMDGKGQRVVGTPDQYGALFQETADAYYAPAREMFPRPFEPLRVKDTRGLDQQSAAAAIRALKLPPVQHGLAMGFAAINGHSDPEKSSYLDQLRWYALGDFDLWNLWDNLGRYRIRGGTRALVDRMQADSRATLMANSPVQSVSQSETGVTVRTSTGQVHEGRTAIVAAPLNCLVDIDFQPALSDAKLQVSRQRHTGSGTKVYAQIKGNRPRFMGHGPADLPLTFVWTEYDDGDSHVLCGFGPSPDMLDINDDDAVLDAIRQYAPDAELMASYGYDWNLDPYAKGTWCMYPPGVLTEKLAALQAPEGRIYFASGDIASGWRGFLEGAVESGASAAVQVSDRVRNA